MLRKYYYIPFLLLLVVFFNACKEDKYTVPEAKTEFQNDCIIRSLGPNIVGQNIEFVYAMALGYKAGKITSAQVEASIAGSSGTLLENRSFYTNSSGADIPVTIGSPATTTGTKTMVTFTKDTCAAALRYYTIYLKKPGAKPCHLLSLRKQVPAKMLPLNWGHILFQKWT